MAETPKLAPSPAPASPLLEADPNSLDRLMSLDPFKMQERDRAAIVAELRRQRAVWAAAEAAGATKAPRAPKGAKPPPGPVDASDLGL